MNEKLTKTEPKPCKICDSPTAYVFNINLTSVPICDECANSVLLQQAQFLVTRIEWQPEKPI